MNPIIKKIRYKRLSDDVQYVSCTEQVGFCGSNGVIRCGKVARFVGVDGDEHQRRCQLHQPHPSDVVD